MLQANQRLRRSFGPRGRQEPNMTSALLTCAFALLFYCSPFVTDNRYNRRMGTSSWTPPEGICDPDHDFLSSLCHAVSMTHAHCPSADAGPIEDDVASNFSTMDKNEVAHQRATPNNQSRVQNSRKYDSNDVDESRARMAAVANRQGQPSSRWLLVPGEHSIVLS